MFQFLIGKIKTPAFPCALVAPIEFQFLIGKIKTPSKMMSNMLGWVVSIPYR